MRTQFLFRNRKDKPKGWHCGMSTFFAQLDNKVLSDTNRYRFTIVMIQEMPLLIL